MDVRYALYDNTRFPEHLPYARCGHLFTVPGDFPEGIPPYAHVTSQEMAVYRVNGDWEVRDVNGERRVWGTGRRRKDAVNAAFAVIARERRIRAARITDRRVQVLGLEAACPYQVEITGSITLICTPTAIAVLDRTETSGDGPARHHVHDVNGGDPYVIRADDSVTERTTTAGVLHNRCGCAPENAARFESETQALVYARHALTVCHPCPKTPAATEPAPAAGERPDGTPGENAGPCAQCGCLLIWDRTGRRVNDEFGEYICTRRSAGTKSNIHLLAVPEPAEQH
ncbi:hypothetical protein [Streptomyces sp. NPDC047070]|uniref:hypothetical protein n=1 Tax=Streptomyces sp. NPDC047070 TaxID=3154923 RepID=UPI0034525F63